MTYVFTFDASACSGCKACQIACKDKNNLPVGVLWRRVYEVSGGSWQQVGNAWASDIFAYNLSIACNHCVHPKCAGVCPTDAYVQREDGIVYIDVAKCMGCGYCSWACPYGVPQYHPGIGRMTKCDFCFDEVDSGLPPSCVAACPMRVLDFVDSRNDQLSGNGFDPLWKIPAANHPFPLADFSRTEPQLALKPHTGMINSLEKKILNIEEIKSSNTRSEVSLLAFTLFVQTAAGAFLAVQWMFKPLWNMNSFDGLPFQLIPYLLIGVSLGFGIFFTFAHLGTKKNAWRALIHLRKSWLSREVLFLGLFGLGWAVTTLSMVTYSSLPSANWLTALMGIGLVYSMAMVYRLRSVPAWDSWRTNVGFFFTAFLNGHLLMAVVLAFALSYTGNHLSPILIRVIMSFITVLLAGQLGLQLLGDGQANIKDNLFRMSLIAIGIVLNLMIFIFPSLFINWVLMPIFIFVLLEETLGCWQFYEARIKTD
jgi:anaerobic dimethyl sulfoxide reductase subunit B (iron-sulfur subunit)